MGLYKDWQRRQAKKKGLLTPSKEDVAAGAWKAGFTGMVSDYPTFSEVAADMEEEGWWAGIVAMFKWGGDEAGKAYVRAHNDFVKEYQAAKERPNSGGAYNVEKLNAGSHATALLHAERYITWKYPPSAGTQPSKNQREEGWGTVPRESKAQDEPEPLPRKKRRAPRTDVMTMGPRPGRLTGGTPIASAKPAVELWQLAAGALVLFLAMR